MSGLITLPRMGETMEEGRIAAWLKAPGEAFRRGEIIAEIETDKVTVEMPALAEGELTEIVAAPGTSVAVGEVIARYRPHGQADSGPAPAPAEPKAPVASAAPVKAPPPPVGDRLRATPVARRMARAAGLDLASLPGTGRRGRIESGDVAAAASPAAQATRVLDLPQGRMAYREWGAPDAARRVLLLHGFSADAATWGSVASGLARAGARVVAPDLPSHGATAFDAGGFDALCEAAAGFAERLGLGGAEVLGHSLGGAVAARLARRLRPARLTLIAPAGLGADIDAGLISGLAGAATPGAIGHLMRRLACRPPALSPAQLDAMAREFARGRLAALARELAPATQGIDVTGDLAAFPGPLKLIWGLEDRVIPWTHCAHAPSRAAIHLIADAGHMPHWDKPQELAALI